MTNQILLLAMWALGVNTGMTMMPSHLWFVSGQSRPNGIKPKYWQVTPRSEETVCPNSVSQVVIRYPRRTPLAHKPQYMNRYLKYLEQHCLFPFDKDCRELLA
jgi:hypothetical protein